MTRARTLKSTIRTRMLKTGERYTAARRHVLAAPAPAAAAPASPRPASAKTPARTAATEPRGAVSDARAVERTGHDLAHWFAVLDRFGAVEKGHTAAARHLRDEHAVDGWYSQGITVAYERARGSRSVNQRTDGTYEVGASKLVAADLAAVVTLLEATTARARWTKGLDQDLVRALVAGMRGPAAKGLVVKANAQRRCRFQWQGTVVEVMLTPRAERTHVGVTHTKLKAAGDVGRRRVQWRALLTAVAAAVTPG